MCIVPERLKAFLLQYNHNMFRNITNKSLALTVKGIDCKRRLLSKTLFLSKLRLLKNINI
jgi:hypothetical protein